ncbi:MAG TPA: peptidylprolyl isomerase [Magnetospirillaceae bacterium]|nr:peptidylprolyl isomerase [Magnetospirillaceae bacterium]
MVVGKDKVVRIDYILKDSEGQMIDGSGDSQPHAYLHGNGNLIPGLERRLEGREAGDRISCSVPPADAYGEYDENLVFKIRKFSFADPNKIEKGMQFEFRSEAGLRVVTVVAIEDDEVTVDANHPLAGEDLHFDVLVVDIREATPEELARGHVYSGEACECESGCGCEDDCGDECRC